MDTKKYNKILFGFWLIIRNRKINAEPAVFTGLWTSHTILFAFQIFANTVVEFTEGLSKRNSPTSSDPVQRPCMHTVQD